MFPLLSFSSLTPLAELTSSTHPPFLFPFFLPCSFVCSFLFQMAVMISSGFLIAWAPYVAVSFWSMLHSREQGLMTPFITLLPCLFAKSSTVYNPFIYFIFQRSSWHELLHLRKLMFCCSHQASSPADGGKLEGKMVKGSDCTFFEDGTDETCVGLMGAPGKQSGSEMMNLG